MLGTLSAQFHGPNTVKQIIILFTCDHKADVTAELREYSDKIGRLTEDEADVDGGEDVAVEVPQGRQNEVNDGHNEEADYGNDVKQRVYQFPHQKIRLTPIQIHFRWTDKRVLCRLVFTRHYKLKEKLF